MSMTDEVVLLEIQRGKEGADKLRITTGKFNGYPFVGVREFYNKDGQWLPGKKGISFKPREMGQILEALTKANETVNANKGDESDIPF